MIKLLNFLKLYSALFFVEIVFIFFEVLLFDSSKIDTNNIRRAWLGTGLWNFWRILFYGLPFLVLYFIFFKYVRNIKLHKPLLFSFFNLFLYATLSAVSRAIWGKNVPLPPEGLMFWVTCISIFLSPLIIGQIPYFKKLIVSL